MRFLESFVFVSAKEGVFTAECVFFSCFFQTPMSSGNVSKGTRNRLFNFVGDQDHWLDSEIFLKLFILLSRVILEVLSL